MWARYNIPAVQMLEPYLEQERRDRQYPFADIVDSGALVAGGSDWPIYPQRGGPHLVADTTNSGPDAAAGRASSHHAPRIVTITSG